MFEGSDVILVCGVIGFFIFKIMWYVFKDSEFKRKCFYLNVYNNYE